MSKAMRVKLLLLFASLCFILVSFAVIAPQESSPGIEAWDKPCTEIIVGKDATVDGSVIMAANDDWKTSGHLVKVNEMAHDPGETFTLISGLEIPQVPVTFGYTYDNCTYTSGTRDRSWVEGMNENQVSVALGGTYNWLVEDAWGNSIDMEGGQIEGDDIPWLVLERATSARHAIEIVGDLIEQYGFIYSNVNSGSGSVVVPIADPDEGWWLELIPVNPANDHGGVWIAERVPDNAVSVRPNTFGIQNVYLTDADGDGTTDDGNVMYGPGLVQYGIDNGFIPADFDPQVDEFNFFDYMELVNIWWWPPKHEKNTRRRWAALSLLGGEELSPGDHYQFTISVEPNSISHHDVMAVMSDVFEGTRFDLTNDIGAGSYENPFYEAFAGSLANSDTVVSNVFQHRNWLPDEIGGVMWVAFDTPTTSVYTPWYAGGNSTPLSYQIGVTGKYDAEAAWWHFQEVGNLCYRRYNEAALQDVIPVYSAYQQNLYDYQPTLEADALDVYTVQGAAAARDLLTDYSTDRANDALDTAKALEDRLRGKYLDNMVQDWGYYDVEPPEQWW